MWSFVDQDKGYTERVMLIYDGLHYDALGVRLLVFKLIPLSWLLGLCIEPRLSSLSEELSLCMDLLI